MGQQLALLAITEAEMMLRVLALCSRMTTPRDFVTSWRMPDVAYRIIRNLQGLEVPHRIHQFNKEMTIDQSPGSLRTTTAPPTITTQVKKTLTRRWVAPTRSSSPGAMTTGVSWAMVLGRLSLIT